VFIQLNIVFEKVLIGMLGRNRQKVMEKVELVRILVFVGAGNHILACIFIYLGKNISGSWFYSNGFDVEPESRV
jgi:hypothetical protein